MSFKPITKATNGEACAPSSGAEPMTAEQVAEMERKIASGELVFVGYGPLGGKVYVPKDQVEKYKGTL